MGTPQESCGSSRHGRDRVDCDRQPVWARFTGGVLNDTHTRDVLGPSVRFWLGDSLRG